MDVQEVDENTKNEIKNAINANKTIKTEVVTNNVQESKVSGDAEKVKSALKDNSKIGEFFEVNVILKVDDREIGKINTLEREISIIVPIPQELPKLETGYKRTYKILRVHDNKVEELETVNNENGSLTFKTNKFSTYALAYTDTKIEEEQPNTTFLDDNKDTNQVVDNTINNEVSNTTTEKKEESNPITGDTIMVSVILLVIAIVGIYAVSKISKKK